jgi:hypothetical protein
MTEPEPLAGDIFIEGKKTGSRLHGELPPGIPTYHPVREGGNRDAPATLVRTDVIQELDEHAG